MKKGISLITLVITIIVVIILAGAVIFSLTQSNPAEKANEAVFKSNVKTYKEELDMYHVTETGRASGAYDRTSITKKGNDVKDIIKSIKAKDIEKFEIKEGELVYIGTDETEIKWLKEINILAGEKTPEVPEIFKNNAPVLATGMTPIKWSGTAVTDTTSSDSSWYNYESKQWANARTVDNSMWVWIPRYEYKIPTRSSTAQTIVVNFIPTTQTTPTSGYTIHPAFTFGGTQLAGIWVAKFEASGTTSAINVVPEVPSLRGVTINDMFTACLNMATQTAKYGWSTTNLDTHLMKNVEWGAVAYLTQSTYGKNAEVWINPDSNYTTGRAGTGVSVAGTTSTYAYNNATYGVQASTTGNVYGIYDMSGCAWEYVAGYVNNGNGSLSTYGNSLYTAGSQYKDVYTSSGDTTSGNYNANASKVGDAVYETSTADTGTTSWFADYSYMPYSSSPFFIRGGHCSNTADAGVFAFRNSLGGAASSIGFRPVVALGSGL